MTDEDTLVDGEADQLEARRTDGVGGTEARRVAVGKQTAGRSQIQKAQRWEH